MTRKCALSGLAAGGGKVVVLEHDGLDRARAFARLGQFVEELGGVFRTAGDLGTTPDDVIAMARRSRFVHTDESNLASAVARGMLRCVEACAAVHGAAGVSGLRVAVQGCGVIGAAVATALADAGASLVIADLDESWAIAFADELDADVGDPTTILTEDVDIVCPCAVGGVLTVAVADQLRAWAVCGAANNIVAGARAEQRLLERGILFVPDVVASAGAVIEGIGKTVMGLGDRTGLIDGLGATARALLEDSVRTGRTASELAAERARARIAQARAASSP
jgi:leucine dehydrogenase